MYNSLDTFLKNTNFAAKINNPIGINGSVMQMMQSQQVWQKQWSAIVMNKSLFKGIGQIQKLHWGDIARVNKFSQSISFDSKLLQIPASAFNAIKGISQLHENLFANLKGIGAIAEFNKSYPSHVDAIRTAMGGISGHIAQIAARSNNWQILEEFEQINDQAFDLTINLSADAVLTEDDSIKFQSFVDNVFEFFKNNKQLSKKAHSFLTLVVLIFNLYQIQDTFKSKPELATREDIIHFEKKIIQALETKFREQKEFRITNRIVKVMLKPKKKTLIITSLPRKFKVTVLQINHKWIFVSYINPVDNLMETGWIMKKYLDK